jgi:hypothetical protein
MSMSFEEIAALSDEDLLCQIAEEASEVIQPVLKHRRFGPMPFAGGVQYDNVRDARVEFTQLVYLMEEHKKRWGYGGNVQS